MVLKAVRRTQVVYSSLQHMHMLEHDSGVATLTDAGSRIFKFNFDVSNNRESFVVLLSSGGEFISGEEGYGRGEHGSGY